MCVDCVTEREQHSSNGSDPYKFVLMPVDCLYIIFDSLLNSHRYVLVCKSDRLSEGMRRKFAVYLHHQQ